MPGSGEIETGIRVFLSYAREDEAAVKEVYKFLVSNGFRPWMDVLDLAGGEDWNLSIRRAIRHSNFFLAFISRHSISKAGVLQQEIESAVEIRRENLESERFLIPVLLDDSAPPESLRIFQWIKLGSPDGKTRLLAALGYRKRPTLRYSLAVASALLIGIVCWRQFTPGTSDALAFQHSRSATQPKTAVPAMIGVTVWEFRPSQPTDPSFAREVFHPEATAANLTLTPVRAPVNFVISEQSKFRLTVESTLRGYLYVIDQEKESDGSLGRAIMVFPTLRIRGGENVVQAGDLVEMPATSSNPPFWQIQEMNTKYQGEVFSILLTAQPIDGLSLTPDPLPIPADRFQDWLRQWKTPVIEISAQEYGNALTSMERMVANDTQRRLTSSDPAPARIFKIASENKTGHLIQFRLVAKTGSH